MCQVDRGKYTNPNDAYIDSPQGIGYGATISAPHMVCKKINYKFQNLCYLNEF